MEKFRIRSELYSKSAIHNRVVESLDPLASLMGILAAAGATERPIWAKPCDRLLGAQARELEAAHDNKSNAEYMGDLNILFSR